MIAATSEANANTVLTVELTAGDVDVLMEALQHDIQEGGHTRDPEGYDRQSAAIAVYKKLEAVMETTDIDQEF